MPTTSANSAPKIPICRPHENPNIPPNELNFRKVSAIPIKNDETPASTSPEAKITVGGRNFRS